MKNIFRTILPAIILSAVSSPAFAAELNVDGVWMTAGRSGIVEIKDCWDGTPCGTLVWVLPFDNGAIPLDDKNPDPELAKRSMLGVSLLSGFKAKGDKWKSGTIYNPEDGKTYKSHLVLASDNVLKVKGCIGPICQTQIWHRLPFDNK